ncbi:docking protein 2-like [Pollicipes pollicipes]|uniref:docking protein 2-like n=1 Tax=Pollicipes pollicipes TaxID=41117 RepID=UPI001884D955|nr:docking protein 2-like [Pollicipes pollicipes]
MEGEIKSGFLYVPPTNWLQHLLSKPWVQKQCVLYPASRQGVKRLELFDLTPSLHRKEPAALIIPLNDCLKIAQERHKQRDFVFSVVTRDESHVFGAVSLQEMQKWVEALQKIAFGNLEAYECPKMLAAAERLQQEILDDNDLYGLADGGEAKRNTFVVSIDANEMASRLQLRGSHLLEVSADAVLLRSAGDRRLRYTWLFQHIRRYGQTRGGFLLETGRSSETGAGLLIFRTASGALVQKCLLRAISAYESSRRSSAPDLPLGSVLTLERKSAARQAAIAKPPRRTKGAPAEAAAATAAAADLPNVVPLADKQRLFLQSFEQPTHADPLYESGEMMYDEPKQRRSAWRELGSGGGSAEGETAGHSANSRSSSSYSCLQHLTRST